MLTKTFIWACTCMCVCVCVELACMTTPLPPVRQHLREAAMEMCAPPQHTNTHTVEQTNSVRSLCEAPVWALPILHNAPSIRSFSCPFRRLSLRPVIQSAVNVRFLLKHIKPTGIAGGALIMLLLSSLISTNRVNLLRGTALRLSQS